MHLLNPRFLFASNRFQHVIWYVYFGALKISHSLRFGFEFQPPQHQQGNNIMWKQRPQTLDSLFANMKEQRMKIFSRKNNATAVQRNRNGQQMPPWGRGRFGN